MSVSLEILPLSSPLALYGEPDASSAYSLSGHISIALHSPYSFLQSQPPSQILLQSLEITFEGQSEVFAPKNGYSSLRLCTITRELIPAGGVELKNEGTDGEPSHWNVTFNLPIPGWLPATSTIGADSVGTRYTLFATAKLIQLGEVRSSTWLSTLCMPSRSPSKVWSVQCNTPMRLERFATPPSTEQLVVPNNSFLITCTNTAASKDSGRTFPPDLLKKVRIIAEVPRYVDVEGDRVPLTLRLKADGFSAEDASRVSVDCFQAAPMQIDKCRSHPKETDLTRFPIPGPSQQPPRQPLRRSHPLSVIHRLDMLSKSDPGEETVSRTFSLLPDADQGIFKLEDADSVFTVSSAEESEASQPWYNLETDVPITLINREIESSDWAGRAILRPTASSPLFSVEHQLRIAIHFSYRFEDGTVVTEPLKFAIPLKFSCVAPPPVIAYEDDEDGSNSTAPALQRSNPYVQSLPIYSQLFYSNGDRKPDHTPLPVYSLHDENDELPPLIPYDKLYGLRMDTRASSSESDSLLS